MPARIENSTVRQFNQEEKGCQVVDEKKESELRKLRKKRLRDRRPQRAPGFLAQSQREGVSLNKKHKLSREQNNLKEKDREDVGKSQ